VEDGEDITTRKVWSVARGPNYETGKIPEEEVQVEVIDALWPSYTSLYVLQETRHMKRAFIWLC
jgi:hypothetical protein